MLGLGPIGDMAARIAHHLGYRVIAVDLVPERLARVAERGIETIDLKNMDADVGDVIRDLTDGRGTDAVIDAVGMEAHGSPATKTIQQAAGLLPDVLGKRLLQTAGVLPLDGAPHAYDIFQKKRDGAVKVILRP